MTPSLGVNLRVTGHCNQGGRKYMEDIFSVAYQQTGDEKNLEYAFFGIFDGHGGREAAQFAKDNLMDYITRNIKFWSDDDDTVLRAIREGFLETQKAMWSDLPKWRKTASGLPSTAGTTASICFIKRGKLFVGHVGDSGIILGERDPLQPARWRARRLTSDHKPECEPELSRIQDAGGKVISKSGVPRVVWYRPSGGHQGPVRRSTHIDEVPFLAVARALGDLWSYNAKDDIYVVSPDPDLHVYDVNVLKDRCLILGTDGVWNVINPEMAVHGIFEAERNNEQHMIDPQGGHTWINPSKRLVDMAIDRWNSGNLRADNTSVVTVMLDPPGPPRAQVLRKMRAGLGDLNPRPLLSTKSPTLVAAAEKGNGSDDGNSDSPKSKQGISIISRYPNSKDVGQKTGLNLVGTPSSATRIIHDSTKQVPLRVKSPTSRPADPEPSGPLQCNKVTSSDEDASPAGLAGPRTRMRTQKQSVHKPRVAAVFPVAAVVEQPENDSDSENLGTPRTRRSLARAAKTAQVPPRALRPRNTPISGRAPTDKRKRRPSNHEMMNVAAKVLKTTDRPSSILRSHNRASPNLRHK